MQEDFFIDLLKRYREGKTTPEEARMLEVYYKSFDLKPDVTDSMPESELEQLKEAIHQEILPERRGLKRQERALPRVQWRRLAAAAVALLIGATFIFRQFGDGSFDPEATLQTPGMPATRTNNLVQLPDGSLVILSPGSTLDFPDTFDGLPTREVVLKGEAYFDVKRMPDRPFIVHSGKLKTTVLGTSFNVKALPGDESITVTVITGKVQVGDEKETLAVLRPDEQIVYHVEDAKKDVLEVDADALASWKLDDLYCDDITVAQAALLIEERYRVTVQITDEQLKEKRFTTTFGKEETLESVLSSMALFNEAVYVFDADSAETPRVVLSPRSTTSP
ncbi:MAG: hypothetical protein ABS46_18615 [Cytophagaceae bacterium SCN 52-12]|nr:MAG: hypothetical protein ABS46_18615 [Cytophagaceae bacterium SCN 52-12]